MNTVDLLIVVLLIAAVAFGSERGFWLTVFEYFGLFAGLITAAALAPLLIDRLAIESLAPRVAIVIAMLSLGATIGSIAGRVLGEPIREIAHTVRVGGALDNVAGAALTAIMSLSAIWYLGLTFSAGPSPGLAREIQGSAILRRLDDVAPRPPALLARLERELSGELFPQVFAGLQPQIAGDLDVDPAAVQTPEVLRAAHSTVKVQALGCGGINVGSGFVVGPQRVLTNAHVVSGTRSVSITVEGQTRPSTARVIFFDPKRDVAILLVPGLELAALPGADAQRGTQVAVIGYPGGGPQRTVPGVIEEALSARGRDIYNEALVSRNVWVVDAVAEHGNSGGPVVDAAGRMVGVIFAASLSEPSQAFALTRNEVAPDIEASLQASTAIDTRAYSCVS